MINDVMDTISTLYYGPDSTATTEEVTQFYELQSKVFKIAISILLCPILTGINYCFSEKSFAESLVLGLACSLGNYIMLEPEYWTIG